MLQCWLKKDKAGDRLALIRSGCYCKSQGLLSAGKCLDHVVRFNTAKLHRLLHCCCEDLLGVKGISEDVFPFIVFIKCWLLVSSVGQIAIWGCSPLLALYWLPICCVANGPLRLKHVQHFILKFHLCSESHFCALYIQINPTVQCEQ